MTLDIEDLVNMAKDLLDVIPDGWRRNLKDDLAKLTEEVGEVAGAINKNSKTKVDLAHELSDVISVCFVMAIRAGIDLDFYHKEKQKERLQKRFDWYYKGKAPEGWKPRVKV